MLRQARLPLAQSLKRGRLFVFPATTRFSDDEQYRARAALREITGEIEVLPAEDGVCLEAKVGLNEKALFRAAGSSQIIVVAGAGFDLYTKRALTLPIVPASLRWITRL